MTILLPTVAITFAAFCVWLTVRIVNRRERWAKWTLAVVVRVPVLYVASFGPACWLCDRDKLPLSIVRSIFRPLAIASVYSPFPNALIGYGKLLTVRESPLLPRIDVFCTYADVRIPAARLVIVEAAIERNHGADR